MTGDRKKRILAIHRYYAPDSPPYATMLQHIVKEWHSSGFDVDVLTSQPSYKSAIDNAVLPRVVRLEHGAVIRLRLRHEIGRPAVRLVNAAKLCLSLLWYAVIRRRYDAVMISTSPPVIGGFIAIVVAKLSRAKFIYHCMDIHPEIGRISGEFKMPAVYRVLLELDVITCKLADAVVVLSEDMKQALLSRKGGVHCNVTVINNFSLPSNACAQVDAVPINPQKFTILFAGNIGRFQGLGSLVEAMALLKSRSDIEAIFMGEGQMRSALEERAGEVGANIRFVGHHPVAVAKSTMQQVSVGYVSLAKNICRYAYPSKTTTYLEQGCPLLVSVEPESVLAKSVAESDLGVVVPPGEVKQLAATIERLASDKTKVQQYRKNATAFGDANFSTSVVLPSWSKLIKGLLQ